MDTYNPLWTCGVICSIPLSKKQKKQITTIKTLTKDKKSRKRQRRTTKNRKNNIGFYKKKDKEKTIRKQTKCALGCLEIVVDSLFSVFLGGALPVFRCLTFSPFKEIWRSGLGSAFVVYDMPYL